MSVSIYAIAAVLCLQTLSSCVTSTIGQYIYSFYLQTYPFTSNNIQNLTNNTLVSLVYNQSVIDQNSEQCSNNVSNDVDAWAQQESADLFYKRGLWSGGPMIIMTCVLGLYTNKFGRRFVLILPMIGISIQLFIWLSIIYFQLQEYWWYVAAFILGLTGNDGVLTLVLNLLITDCTNESDRSTRFILLEGMTTALTAIADVGIGYYIAWRGFTDLFWAAFGLQSISILIVILFFKSPSRPLLSDEKTDPLLSYVEVYNDVRIKGSCCSITSCKNSTVFGSHGRSRKKSVSLLLTFFAYIFYSLAYAAIWSTFLWYLLDVPFCWSSTQIGNYGALSSIFCAVFSVLGMKLLIRVGTNDAIICTLSHVFFLVLALWLAFARQSWQLYASLLITPFVDYQNALTWSMMSKWLEPYDLSTAFTFITVVHTICSILGTSFFTWVYEITVVDLPYLTFLLSAALCVIPFILNICLFMVNQRLPNDKSLLIDELDLQTPLIDTRDSDLIYLDIPTDIIESQSNSFLSENDETLSIDDPMIF